MLGGAGHGRQVLLTPLLAQDQLHLVTQLVIGHRLQQEIVAPGLVGGNAGFRGVVDGDEHHRHVGVLEPGPQAAAGLVAIQSRHLDVEQHQIPGPRGRQEGFAVGKQDRGMGFRQQFLEQEPQDGIVFHYGDAGRHCASPSSNTT